MVLNFVSSVSLLRNRNAKIMPKLMILALEVIIISSYIWKISLDLLVS